MTEIIGPDGKKYYSEDHNFSSSQVSQKVGGYLSLVLGIVALLIALYLLADIAIGLILLFLGTTSVNYYLSGKR